MDADLGQELVPSRRFGIIQGGKLRCIDDFSELLVNSACGVSESIEVGGVDEIVLLARLYAQSLRTKRCRFVSADGEVLDAPVHSHWCNGGGSKLVGRLLDLRNA